MPVHHGRSNAGSDARRGHEGARVGRPHGYSGLSDLIGTPAYATPIGLVGYALSGRERVAEPVVSGAGGGPDFHMPSIGGGVFRRIASLGRALMPN